MHHISLPSLHGHDVELLGRERKTPISFFFLNFNITPEEFLNFKQIVKWSKSNVFWNSANLLPKWRFRCRCRRGCLHSRLLTMVEVTEGVDWEKLSVSLLGMKRLWILLKILKKTSERKEMKKDTDYYCWFLAGCWCIYIFYIDESYLCFENGSGCTVTNNLVTVRGSYYIFLLDLKLENNGTEREREFH